MGTLPAGERAALLRRLRQQGTRPAAAPDVVAARPRTELPPASHAQEQLWFVDRVRPADPTYDITYRYRIAGPLDADALERALRDLVDRHEALRTSFVPVDGVLRQQVAPPGDFLVQRPALAGADPAARRRKVDQLVAAMAHRGFRLDRGPLCRALLVRVDDDEHELVWQVHHAVYDGWSVTVGHAELAELYRSRRAGTAASLAPVALHPADHAGWERDLLASPRAVELAARWRERLAGATGVELFGGPRPRVEDAAGGTVGHTVPAPVLDAARATARTLGATLPAVLLAAWFALAHRYSGRDDLVIGTPSANRHRAELRDLVGLLVCVLPVRVAVDPASTFAQVVARTSERLAEAVENQDLPFDRIAEAARSTERQDAAPLLATVFSVVEGVGEPLRLPGVEVSTELVAAEGSRFDLTVEAAPTGDGLRLRAEHRLRLAGPGPVGQLLRHYGTLLAALVQRPDTAVGDVPLVAEADYRAAASSWSGPAEPVPDELLPDGVRRAARRWPDRTAVSGGGDAVSYRELERLAADLAGRLAYAGVGPETRVGVLLPRTPDLIVALLGVLEAGGAYVPVDPSLPAARQRTLLADSGARVVVAAAGADLPGPVRVVPLDLPAGADPGRAVPVRPSPESVAYVLYTSGSTGTPKGVLVTHANAVNLVRAGGRLLDLDEHTVFLQYASVGFDVSVLDIFATLAAGGRVCVAGEEERLSPTLLERTIREQGVTAVDLTPSVARLLDPAACGGLRTVLLAGEALDAATARAWRTGGRRVVNGYGPTEATVLATTEDCTDPDGTAPPIGRPLPNYQAHVLDPAGRPVPDGVPGELHLGGAGVARGYHDQPALTAARFVPDPWSSVPGARLYRTGDLVRRRPDGRLDYLGRLDRQLKVSGVRVEAGEVEAALLELPGVTGAVVDVRPAGAGPDRLVAWVTAGVLAPPAELRRQLTGRLPRYLVPQHLVPVAAFPLTRSGKVDRDRLPDPPEHEPEHPRTPPRTETERRLVAEVVGPLLATAELGVHDDFFLHGGTSLAAAGVIARVADAFGVSVAVADFLADATVAQLAAQIDRARAAGPTGSGAGWPGNGRDGAARPGAGDDDRPVVLRAGHGAALVLVHPIGGEVYCYRELSRALPGDYPVLGLPADRRLRAEPAALEDLAERYLARLDQLPVAVGGWSFGGVLAYEMGRRSTALGRPLPAVLLDAALPYAGDGGVVAGGDDGLLGWFVLDLARSAGLRPAPPPPLTGDGWPDRALAWLREQGLPDVLAPDELARRARTCLDALQALHGYRPRPTDGPVGVVVAEADAEDWRPLVRPGAFRVARVATDHYGLLVPPALTAVAAAVDRAVRAADRVEQDVPR